MKNLYLFLFIILILNSCVSSKNTHNTGIDNGKNSNYLVTGFNIPDEIIHIPVVNSEFDAIKALLMTGFPGTKQSDPVIPVEKQNDFLVSKFYKELQNGYSRYRNPQFDKNNFIAVNLNLLRKDLEYNKFINNFGL
ncbi:MAG: hypothetical protein IPH57_07210 [Saprospiraceae bacterium]|nr:hypothetical protein [Saprospiraceae bacterium]